MGTQPCVRLASPRSGHCLSTGPALGELASHTQIPGRQGPKAPTNNHWGRSEQPELASLGPTPKSGATGQWAWTSCSRAPCHPCATLPFLGVSCSCLSPQVACAPSLMAQGVLGRRASRAGREQRLLKKPDARMQGQEGVETAAGPSSRFSRATALPCSFLFLGGHCLHVGV